MNVEQVVMTGNEDYLKAQTRSVGQTAGKEEWK